MTDKDLGNAYLIAVKQSLDSAFFEVLKNNPQGYPVSLEEVSNASNAVYLYKPQKLIYYNMKIPHAMQMTVVIGLKSGSLFRVTCPDQDLNNQTAIHGDCDRAIRETFGGALNPNG